MKLLIAIVVIAAIAVLGSRITFYRRRKPLFRKIILTGIEYIFLGMVLGRMGLDLLDSEMLKQLQPVLLFALCWIGFLFGLQFETRQLRTLPQHYFSIAAIQSVFTFVAVALPLFFLLRFITTESDGILFVAAAVLGGSACCTAQSSLAVVAQNRNLKDRHLLDFLRYISSIDGLLGLIFFALAMCVFSGIGTGGFDQLASWKWLLFSVLIGLLPSLILIAISQARFTQREFLLILVGTIMFCAGLAHTTNHSPLVSGFVCGVILSNFCRHRHRALMLAIKAEKAFYIFLLLLVGAVWQLKLDYGLVLMAAYFLIRLAGKVTGVFTATRMFKLQHPVPPYLGLGLVSEGGLAIAMILSFKIACPLPISDALVTVIIFSVLLSELAGPSLVMNIFADKEKS